MFFGVNRSRKIRHLAAMAVFFAGCASSSVVKGDSIAGQIEKEAAALNKSMEHAYRLKTKRVAASGFYYIISRSGRVVFHPQTVLIGADMSGMSFVAAILQQEGDGCIEYTVDEKVVIIFFRPIKNNNILCLSIPKEEVTGFYGECADFEVK
ncbi:MAG: hypothetical protein FWG92_05645 [Leptospirales bacterium]|nr:hypothetical protein [Leptospirales bacterium]